MSTLVWNHSCTVGVRALDDQHGILLDSLNELRLALLHGLEGKIIGQMLVRVADLMRMHVGSEERLLELHGFPELASHKAESKRLLGRLAQFEARYEQWQSGMVLELVQYLRKWFTAHTGVAGQKYGSWLHECGVQ